MSIPYRSLLWMTDGSERAQACEGWVQLLARMGAAQVHVAHATGAPLGSSNPFPHVGDYDEPVILAQARQQVGAICQLLSSGGIPCQRHFLAGQPVEVAQSLVDEHEIELVVCGRTGTRGIDRLLLGSTAARLVRRLSSDVLVVERPLEGPMRSIVCPIDPRHSSQPALSRSSALARASGAALTLLVVVPPGEHGSHPEARGELEALARQQLDPMPPAVAWQVMVVEESDVARGIRTAADGFDLVVMGAAHRRGFERLVLGSVTEAVVNHCSVPVLVAR